MLGNNKNYFQCHRDILSQRCHQQSDLGGSGKRGLEPDSPVSWTAATQSSILGRCKSSYLYDFLFFSPTFISVSLKSKFKIQKKGSKLKRQVRKVQLGPEK